MGILLGRFAVCSSPSLAFHSKRIHMATLPHVPVTCMLLAVSDALVLDMKLENYQHESGGLLWVQDLSEQRGDERADFCLGKNCRATRDRCFSKSAMRLSQLGVH